MKARQRKLRLRDKRGASGLAASPHEVRGRGRYYDPAARKGLRRWLRALDRQMRRPQMELPL